MIPRSTWRRQILRTLPGVVIAECGVGAFLYSGTVAHGATLTSHAGSTRPTESSAASAQLAYLRDCATCHGADARGTEFGPTLQGVGAASVDYWVSTGRMPLVSNGRPAKSPQGLAPPGQYVADPNARIQRRSPQYSTSEIAALVAYVSSIAPGGPSIPTLDLDGSNLATGGQIFRLQCAACHSWSGVGGALYQRSAPSLRKATPNQIAEAMRTGPGQMPAFGAAAVPNDQLDDVVGYVRYVDHPDDRGGQPLWYLGPVAEGAIAILLGLGALLLVSRWIGSRG